MDFKELLKKYWFIAVVALGLLAYFIAYGVNAINNREILVDTKKDGDKYVIYSLDGENYYADDLYQDLYNNYGTVVAAQAYTTAVARKAIKDTDEITAYAQNYANYIAANNDQTTIDSYLKSLGYKGFEDLTTYCLDMVKEDYLYNEFYVNNYDKYVKKIVEEYKPKKVSHILVKVADVTKNEDGSFTANPTKEESKKLEDVLSALKTQSFEEVAKTYSEDGSNVNGGYLGIYDSQTASSQFVKAFADATNALDFGKTSEAVLSEYGWHIIKVEKPTDDELKADIGFISEASSYYSYSNVKAVNEKANELGFVIKDEKLKALIDEYLVNAESEVAE